MGGGELGMECVEQACHAHHVTSVLGVHPLQVSVIKTRSVAPDNERAPSYLRCTKNYLFILSNIKYFDFKLNQGQKCFNWDNLDPNR